MKKCIKIAGNMQDVTKALKTLAAAFGKGATLSTVAQVVQAQKLKNTINEQLKKL